MKLILTIFALTSLLSSATLSEYGYDIELAANKEDSVKITVDELAFIYTGKLEMWSSGERIRLFVRRLDNHCQKQFVLSLLGVSMNRFRESVKRYDHINVLGNREMMISVLLANPGSIGIISQDEVILSTREGLITLEIEL